MIPSSGIAAVPATLWLASPPPAAEPPPRARCRDRAARDALFAHLSARGASPLPGALLSHAGGHAAYLAGEPGRAGIDLEWIRPRDSLALARFAFAPREVRALEALHGTARDEAFIAHWVLKEAAAKLLGLDLFSALARCEFRVEGERIEGDVPHAGPWQAWVHAPRPALRVAVMRFGAGPCPLQREWQLGEPDSFGARWPLVAATA
jgi:4'-phosphopantetheinyl transferase